MSTDRFTTGKTTDGLVNYCLENRSRQVFLGGALVDQGLDIRLCKYTAASGDGVHGFVIFCIFVKTGCIGLQEGCHLVNKRTCTSGTDTIHTLLYISTFKIDNLGIFTAQLDGNVRLRSIGLQGFCHGDDLLCEWHIQILCQRQSAGTGDHRINIDGTQLINGFGQQVSKCLLNVGKMPFIIGE